MNSEERDEGREVGREGGRNGEERGKERGVNSENRKGGVGRIGSEEIGATANNLTMSFIRHIFPF